VQVAEAARPPGEERPRQGEGQGEYGMLELDHFERQAEAFENHPVRTSLFYAMTFE
jgi:hypothetical protein